MLAKLIKLILFFFFLIPIILFIYFFDLNFKLKWLDLLLAIKNSLFQSTITATLCVGVALLVAPSLSLLPSSKEKLLEKLVLIPSFLPSLLTMMIVFSYFSHFPFGHTGVVIIFMTMYLGFAVISLKKSFQIQIAGYHSLMEVYGISHYDRYRKIYWPRMKTDIFYVFIIIVMNCMTSLSVPLLAGGGKSYSLELFIYQQTVVDGNWAATSVLAIAQFVLLFFMSKMIGSHQTDSNIKEAIAYKKKSSFLASAVLYFYSIFFVGGFVFQSLKSFFSISIESYLTLALVFLRTIVFFVPTGALFLLLVFLMIYLFYRHVDLKFLTYFMLPSATVIGFSLYLFFSLPSSPIEDLAKTTLGFNIAYAIVVWQIYILPQLQRLKFQITISHVFQLGFLRTLKHVIWPQLRNQILFSFLILLLIFMFEFALVKAAGVQIKLTGTLIADLVSSYRLNYGFAYSSLILLFLGIFYGLLKRGANGNH